LGLTTSPPSCAVVMKSGNLNFLEVSGPLQACNGTALPLPLPFMRFPGYVTNCANVLITTFNFKPDKSPSYSVTSLIGLTLPHINLLTPNDPYRGCTAPLTFKRCILYIYSTNIGTEYFKHGIYSQFFPLQNAVCFIILTYLVPVLFTFYIQGVLKLKKIYIPVPKG